MPSFGDAIAAWLRRFWPIIAVFLLAQSLLRMGLALSTGRNLIDTPLDAVRPFLIGLWFDLAVLLIALIPGTLYWLGLPKAWHGGRFDCAMTLAGFVLFLLFISFTMAAEVLFWNEFGARFNFIAVDYLVYTREVASNIWESYPVGKLLAGLTAGALFTTVLLRRAVLPQAPAIGSKPRLTVTIVIGCAAILINATSNSAWLEMSSNSYANELSTNGYYSFVHAFFRNEIDYTRFYAMENERVVNARIRELVSAPNARFTSSNSGDITRDIVDRRELLRKNVVLVTIESLSASFMARFGNDLNLTPHLDALAKEGLLFTRMLATGTRTVRGLEAVTLSVPPTPGQSIVRRPENERLFSLGSVLRDHGYSVTFLYGGDGYFDNMNAFFTGNGYKVVDRQQFSPSEITFSNAWGVCDEDLFARALKEADTSYRQGQLFFQHVMTVSNHRPFTYPSGRIAAPVEGKDPSPRTLMSYLEHTREGGVRYTDYAIGKFIDGARSKPWFNDTLFVFVADHTASSAGKIELDPNAYHIPAIFYAPGFIPPREIDWLVSQIDIAPTILGTLHMSYRSRFVGQDQSQTARPERAFVSNYQKVGFVRGEDIAVLGPRRDVIGFHGGQRIPSVAIDKTLLANTVAFYQHASHWRERFARTDSVVPGEKGD